MTSNTLNIEFDYVETHHDEDLVCQICMSPFVNPLTCPGCQQSCCASHTPLTNCPFCRESWTSRPPVLPPRALLNMLDKFLVRCPNSNCNRGRGGAPLQRGDLPSHMPMCAVPCTHNCGVLVAPRDVEAHSASCAAFVLTCESPGCTHRAPRSAMPAHLVACPAAVVACPHGCPHRGPRRLAMAHVTMCPLTEIACPHGCGVRLLRGDECSHDAVCPDKVVACRSADVGCPHSMPRKLLPEHEAACVFHKDRRLILLERALEAVQLRIAAGEQALAQQQLQLANIFDAQGFAIAGVHKDTGTLRDPAGFDREGFDRDNFNREGFNREGFNREGFNRQGFDRQGFNRQGLNEVGVSRFAGSRALGIAKAETPGCLQRSTAPPSLPATCMAPRGFASLANGASFASLAIATVPPPPHSLPAPCLPARSFASLANDFPTQQSFRSSLRDLSETKSGMINKK